QLDDAHESIESGRARLESGQSELESAQQELIDSESRLSDAAVTLESGRARIDEGQRQLDVTGAQLRDALNTLNGYEAQINSAKAQLDEGRARIDEAQETIAMATEFLHDFSVEINNHKDELRDTLRSAIRSVIGDYADMFDWTDSGELPEVGDPNADFTKYPVTRGFILDLNKSLGDNLYAAIASLGIPEEDLRAAFEAASQIYEELSDGTTWLDRIVEYAVEKYRYYEQEYEDIADCARSWNDYNAQYIDGMARYQAGLEEYNTRLAQYNSARAELDRRWDQYYSGLARYNSGRRQLDDARTQWESGNAEYQSGQSQLEEGRQSIESGAGALESGRADLVERESQYESGLSEYESGLEQLEQSREELIKMDQCRWIVLSAQESSAYVNIARSSQNLKDVAMTFSGVFLFVAALVIFSTLGRIIDEQRTMVGATKAMGLYNREVFTKYLSFGLSGTVIGMALGVVSAYLIVQMIILKGYGKAFIYGMGNYSFNIPLTIIVVIAGAILATVTVWFACHELLRSTAVELMQGKIPSIKYMSKTGKSSTGYLYSKLILRNMLTDKKRVAATIVSVTGCCALLVGGFTIQYAIQNCVTGQFERYEHYDMKVRFDPAKSGNISEVLTENGASYYPVLESVYPVRVSGRLLSMDLLCGDLDGIGDYFTLIDTVTGEEADGNTEGVWIHRKVSESYGLSAGDDIIIFNRTMKPFRVRVAGVYENFIGYYMFMNRQTYSSLFGEEPSDNTYLVINNGADQKSLSALLKVTDGIKSIVDTADSRASYERVSSVLNSVSLICIVMSAMMAYFILLNLVSMFINQKKRELTVMRVNGFSLKQVINYVAREFFVSTVIGTILGLGSGALLGYRVIRLIESDMTQFDRMIQWRGWIFSIIITFIFVTLVCIPAFRKIKYLRLTDINE
ncbi:MAG: FtsX-like permease family protein, partial [Clostridiales bacterium]|nr:FtsX-like permease family protein [Clostridiales bacterium]